MITPDKIEEWLKEVEERPASAALILRLIANRLRELSARNEELLEENIALASGKRVEEYERRIAYLEYQLNLLKRQLGGEPGEAAAPQAARQAGPEAVSLLGYDQRGRIYRWEHSLAELVSGAELGRLAGELVPGGSPVRLLVAPSSDELLFVFTSGRVAALPAAEIPLHPGASQAGPAAPIPVEPHAGETLACLVSIARLPLAQFFVQVSRKGYLKKINIAMAQSILSNHYLGAGIKAAPDQAFELVLAGSADRLALVSQEGYLLGVAVKDLPFAVEEVMRLGASDHLVAALLLPPAATLLVMTQTGKVIQLAAESVETAASFRLKGQPVFSPARRAQGVRVVGAAALSEADWGVALHQDGQLSLHRASELSGAGSLPVRGELLGFAGFRTRTSRNVELNRSWD